MTEVISKNVCPDKRGRISLKGLIKEADGYEATLQPDGSIVLKPYLKVDSKEAWIYKNREALALLEQGLKDATEGKVVKRKSYAEFADMDLN